MGIDFIIIWVDGKDENWRKKKNAYKASEKGDDSDLSLIHISEPTRH